MSNNLSTWNEVKNILLAKIIINRHKAITLINNEMIFDTKNSTSKFFWFQIIAQIYGHSHTDSFRIFQLQKQALNVAFMAPSITPRVNWLIGTNPGIRLFKYNQNYSYLSDYDQFYLDLAKGMSINYLIIGK